MSRRAAAVLVVALAAATVDVRAAEPAAGGEVEQAKARFRHGAELYRQQRWREAAEEFEAAYRLKPHGAIHYNVAQCRERLEEWPSALREYEDYLREVPDAKDRAAVQTSVRKIEERLAKTGVQVLVVYTSPPGARGSVDGVERGKAPFHVALAPGTYLLALALEGYQPVSQTVAISPQASRILDVTLERARPGAVAAAPAPDLTVRPPAPIAPIAAPAPAKRNLLPTWIAAGTAVAAAAVGVAFGISAQADAEAVRSGSGDSQALASSAQSKARTANVFYAIAGGAAVAGVSLYVLETRF